MPTYQYRCTECGRELEVVQKFTDPALTECEWCHGALRKVYNAVGVVFKGSGFYRTDSRKADAKSGAGAANAGAADKSAATSTSNGSTNGESASGAGSTGTKSETVGASGKSPAASSTAA